MINRIFEQVLKENSKNLPEWVQNKIKIKIEDPNYLLIDDDVMFDQYEGEEEYIFWFGGAIIDFANAIQCHPEGERPKTFTNRNLASLCKLCRDTPINESFTLEGAEMDHITCYIIEK